MEENRINRNHDKNHLARRIIYYVLAVLEVLFLFRFIFKLLGANPGSIFVSFIYSVSGAFLAPFYGIFRSAATSEGGIRSVMEINTIVAMVVYALIALGIVKLIELNREPRHRDLD